MEKQVVKEVLERLVEIDTEADALAKEAEGYQAEAEMSVKQKLHAYELETMKAVRVNIKQEFRDANARATAESEALIDKTERYINQVEQYYSDHKQVLVDDLFNAIFGDK